MDICERMAPWVNDCGKEYNSLNLLLLIQNFFSESSFDGAKFLGSREECVRFAMALLSHVLKQWKILEKTFTKSCCTLDLLLCLMMQSFPDLV